MSGLSIFFIQSFTPVFLLSRYIPLKMQELFCCTVIGHFFLGLFKNNLILLFKIISRITEQEFSITLWN